MTTNSADGLPAPGGLVDRDVPCRRCAYNLRGLALTGRCPECGTPVGVSMQGDWLCYSDPQFVRTLRKGVSYILWSLLLLFVLVFLGAGIQAAIGSKSVVFLKLFMLLGYIPSVIGGWLLTSPDPSGIGEERYGTARKFIRITLAIGAANYLFDLGGAAAGGSIPPTAHLVIQSISFVASLAGLAGQFAQLNYLSKLALRIPDERLSKRARNIMWGLGVSYGIFLLIGFGAIVAGIAAKGGGGRSSGLGGILMFVGCFAGVVVIALLVYLIIYIIMLFQFAASLDLQVMQAQTNWGHHPLPPAEGPA